jgi:hypothetical protein
VEVGDVRCRDIRDVRFAAIDARDLAGVEIDARALEAGAGELDNQRQPDIAEADDADVRRARLQFLFQGGSVRRRGRRSAHKAPYYVTGI